MSLKSDPLVPRTEMPQIDEKDIARLIVYMAVHGHSVMEAGLKEPSLLVFHQSVEWDRPIPQQVLEKPILITRLNEIIDGNHRVAAHLQQGSDVPYIQFNCTFVEALDILAVCPFAYEYQNNEERN